MTRSVKGPRRGASGPAGRGGARSPIGPSPQQTTSRSRSVAAGRRVVGYTIVGAAFYTSPANPRRRTAPPHRADGRPPTGQPSIRWQWTGFSVAGDGGERQPLDAGQASLVRQMCTSGLVCEPRGRSRKRWQNHCAWVSDRAAGLDDRRSPHPGSWSPNSTAVPQDASS